MAPTGSPLWGEGGRELALGMPLGVLMLRPGACLLGPRGLLQMAALVALIGFALSLSVWGARGTLCRLLL